VFDEERCEPLLNALANYHKEYDERSKLFRDAPAHEWSSHFADAFRYLAVGWEASVEDEDVKPAPSAAVWFNPLTYQRDSGQGFSPFRK
jgi:phage terminase large subunit